jgi:hypothetical protein
MAFADFRERPSPFERLLEALDVEAPPLLEKGVFSGAGRLWPRVAAAPPREAFHCGEAVEALYVESLGLDRFSAHTTPANADLKVQFAAIREQLARTRTLAELRQLRRHCALLLHPDRVAPPHRFLAENCMAEVNAAIDRAIKGK